MPIPIDTYTPLMDGAYAPDNEILCKTYWLLCRHTSVTYIARMVEMLEAFTSGFAAYVAKFSDPGSFANYLVGCNVSVAEQRQGLARLRISDHTGFKLIRESMHFHKSFGYSNAREKDFYPLGFHDDAPGEALWAWMEKVLSMSGEIDWALRGHVSYPRFDVSKYHFPVHIGGYPLGKNLFVKTGEDIPVTGVWQPITFKSGCPNFLIQGDKAPVAHLPTIRRDTPAWDENWGNGRFGHHKANTFIETGEFPTVWQLVWEDDRWRNGRQPPGEDAYIDGPDTELPKDPPLALRDPPNFP